MLHPVPSSRRKSIKTVIAHGCAEGEMPPKIHNLIKLASDASLINKLSDKQKSLLRKLNPLVLDARYPDYEQDTLSTPTKEICEEVITEVEEFLCWIKKQL